MVTAFDITEGPAPAMLFTETAKRYSTPGVNPSKRTVVDKVVRTAPPGVAVTVYPVTTALPSDEGGAHETVATAPSITAATAFGAPGALDAATFVDLYQTDEDLAMARLSIATAAVRAVAN